MPPPPAVDDRITITPPVPSGPCTPPSAPALPESGAALRRLDLMLVLLVSALAFLLASFPARNGDFWGHLAAGRLLARGEFPFGTGIRLSADPRVAQAWLSDLLGYGLYSAVGGTGLVLLKALLVVGLALLLLRLSRAGRGWLVPAFCTVLALLAMSTRLLLQPATISCLFLALTLWLLRPRSGTEEGTDSSFILPPSSFRGLLLLFVVWVNVDSWFVVGLRTVGLVWLGQVLDGAPGTPSQPGGRLLALLRRAASFAVLGAVCLLNPAHVHAFGLPPELEWLGRPGWSAAFAEGQIMSPFQKAYFKGLGLSPASLAYFPLLGLGLLSFVLNLPRWHWQRFLPWLGLALASAFQARAVPFFAVVAGPVLAWNLQEAWARRSDPQWRQSPAGRREVIAGRVLAVVVGLALVACAWPGWLQGPPFEPRRWAVETAPSLERGAAATRRWHQAGRLGPDARALHLSPDTAHAFAWFCPEERGLVDDRLAEPILGDAAAPADWDERMRAAGVNHVILYDPDRKRLPAALDRLLADPEQWPLLYIEGDLAVFGWRDPLQKESGVKAPGSEGPFPGWELDLNRLAFRPAEGQRAPRKRPEREPEVRRWWEAFWKPAPPRSIDLDEAARHLLHAAALQRSAPYRHPAAWEASQSAALVGAAGGWAGPGALLDAHVRLVLLRPRVPEAGLAADRLPPLDRLRRGLQHGYVLQRDDTPPALLYLAARAARRALAANPADAQAHLALGECYLRLLHGTRERAWGVRLPELVQLRRAQASAALNQAISLNPDLAQAHKSLALLYQEMGYLDLALNHQSAYLKAVHEAGPPRGVSAEEFREQEARAQEELDRLAREVEGRQNAYAAASGHMTVLDRALLAMQKGLAGKARDLLLESDVSAFGEEGIPLELGLLLLTGRPKDVREWISPEHVDALGLSSYYWLRAQALAASGDYALAREECAELARSLALTGPGQDPVPFREAMAGFIGQAVLGGYPGAEGVPGLLLYAYNPVLGRVKCYERAEDVAWRLRREANWAVLRGLLALEEGDVEEAAVAFRVALDLWKDEATADSGGGLDFAGRPIAQACLEWLEAP